MAQSNQELLVNDEEIYIDLRQIIKILGKWSRFIIGLTILAGLAAGLVSHYLLTPIYQADTLLRFTQATEKLATNPNAAMNADGGIDAYTRPILTMNTHLTQIKSPALSQRIDAALARDGYMSGDYTMAASVVKDSNLIEIKVESSDPVLAARAANTLSDQYRRLMDEKNQEQINSSVTYLTTQKEITWQQLVSTQETLKEYQVRPNTNTAAERQELQNTIDRLQQTMLTLDKQVSDTLIAKSVDLGDSSMVVMSEATVPAQPVKPNLIQNVAIALVLGLFLFTLLAFLLEYMDNTVKTTDDFREMELSVLGIIPDNESGHRQSYYGG
ncbi:MAG: hypothetical protein GX133_13045 [Syntrophomonadaceae bacterium]|nr:hypothetical protein [Syntrophomonadaceae bacterium]